MPTLWPYEPNVIGEQVAFNTAILDYRSSELRVSKAPPRQTLRYDTVFTASDALKAEWLFRENASGEWYVPAWHEFTRVSGGISSGASSISVSTDAEYFAGGKALIFGSATAYEVVDILTVGSGVINLDGTVSASYSGAPYVMPIREAVAPTGMSKVERVGPTQTSVQFVLTDLTDDSANPFSQVAGYDVVDDAPRISAPYEGTVGQEVNFTTSGYGASDFNAIEAYVRRTSSVEYTDVSMADRYRRRQWLYAARGRDRPFLLPTFQAELVLTSSILSADTTITVEEFAPDPSDLVGLVIYFPVISEAREITAAVTAAGEHTLTIAALGSDLPVSTTVCMAHLMRFDTDVFEMQHRRAGSGYISKFRAPVIEVSA